MRTCKSCTKTVTSTYVPVKLVIERLCGVVEQRLVLVVSLAKDCDNILTLHIRAFNEVVCCCNVLGVVLIMVDLESSFSNHGLESIVCIRKVGKCNPLFTSFLKVQK